MRAADGDLAERLGGVTEGEGAGRPARQRERGGGLLLLGFAAVVAGVLLVN